MKLTRHIALSIMLTLGVFSAMFYTSCSRDQCKSTTCLNDPGHNRCSAGMCNCGDTKKSGLGGNNCEIVYRDAYVDKSYTGSAIYTSSFINDTIPTGDTVFITRADSNNTLAFNGGGFDTAYNKAQLTWNRPGKASVSSVILLENFSNSGATFTFPPITVDTFTYSGTGNVSAASASLNLIETHPNSPSVIVTLSNFSKR